MGRKCGFPPYIMCWRTLYPDSCDAAELIKSCSYLHLSRSFILPQSDFTPPPTNFLKMRRTYFVEPLVALYAFSVFLISPLDQQYVYRRLWVQLTNTTYPISDNSTACGTNTSVNVTDQEQEVQRQASLYALYSNLITTIPSLFVTLLLVTYSDHGGRKMAIIPPLVGTLLYTLGFLVVSYFELNVYFLIGLSLLTSVFGDVGTFLAGCFAYIADLCPDDHQRMIRMTGLEVMLGLFSGAAAISTGFFLRAAGFNWPYFTSSLFLCLVLIYAIFILEETVTKPTVDDSGLNRPPQRPGLKQLFIAIYKLFAETSRRCKVVLFLLLLVLISLCFANGGGLNLIILYELSEPLCWTEILIGYGAALATTTFVGSYIGVRAFACCGAHPLVIVMVGILCIMCGLMMVAFAKTTLMMFLFRLPMVLSAMPFPVIRSILSKIISKSKQGVLFACVVFLESLTYSITAVVFNSIYANTVAWYPGFSFLLSAGLCIIPLSALGVLALIGIDVPDEVQGAEPINSAEDPSERSPLLR
uniref:Solute carrier family 46 member 3 n=1 Tax=Gouania willdenowi TaxID=441366 RepID=A0A8C5N7U5_GOUWI